MTGVVTRSNGPLLKFWLIYYIFITFVNHFKIIIDALLLVDTNGGYLCNHRQNIKSKKWNYNIDDGGGGPRSNAPLLKFRIQKEATYVIIDKTINPRSGITTLLIQDDGGGGPGSNAPLLKFRVMNGVLVLLIVPMMR